MRRIPLFVTVIAAASIRTAVGGSGAARYPEGCAGPGGGGGGGSSGAVVASVVIDAVNLGNGQVVITPVPALSPSFTG